MNGGFSPCFPVTDMRVALEHYERLGFAVMPYAEGTAWAWARFGLAELRLYLKQDHDPARTAAAADLSVEDCDALAREWSTAGVRAPATPTTRPTACARPFTWTPTTTSSGSVPRSAGRSARRSTSASEGSGVMSAHGVRLLKPR